MRKDMFKVIVERPRHGRLRNRGWRIVGDEDLPQTGPLRPYRSKTKGLNENLAPLERFLDKRAGRYWPKVFSEICEHISVRNAVQKHVRDHVDHLVATKTVKRDDEIWVHNPRFSGPRSLRELTWIKFYVHPVSQVLMRNKHWRRWRASFQARERAREEAFAKRFRPVGPYCARHKLGGVWYEMRLSPAPGENERSFLRRWGAGLREGRTLPAITREQLAEHAPGCAILKRQLSTRELAEAGLANDPGV